MGKHHLSKLSRLWGQFLFLLWCVCVCLGVHVCGSQWTVSGVIHTLFLSFPPPPLLNIFLKRFIFSLCVWALLVCMYICMSPVVHGGQKKALGPWNWSYRCFEPLWRCWELDSVFCKISQSFKLLHHLTSPIFLVFWVRVSCWPDTRQVDLPVSLRDPSVSASPVLGF